MASVTLTEGSSSSYLGGIVGRFLGSSSIRNCVNYGSITYSETSMKNTRVGGITGVCGGEESKYIQNCVNYGTITYNGESKNLYMGGIVGQSWYGTVIVENCVSAGRIVNSTQASGKNYIGSIVGYINSYIEITITHCLWTSDVGHDNVYGHNGTNVTVTSTFLKELNTDTLDELNEYTEKNNTWSNWFMLI